ncbi:MAG: PIG-L deacetylase family protein [Ilumatobacteraceae bacterium]
MSASLHPDLRFGSVLAVCAHPDDESFGLGAIVSTLSEGGVTTGVVCLTHGEASTLGMTADLGAVRATELDDAARALGASRTWLRTHPDGMLASIPLDVLCADVEECATLARADCFLVFDDGGITGHPDHQRATDAALRVAERLGLPVIAWTVALDVAAALNHEFGAHFVGREPREVDLVLEVDRAAQLRAIACHASQSADNPVLWRRLALQGDHESLRWLRR